MKKPVLIIRKSDNEPFIHLGKGEYRTMWGTINGSINRHKLETLSEEHFKFYYK